MDNEVVGDREEWEEENVGEEEEEEDGETVGEENEGEDDDVEAVNVAADVKNLDSSSAVASSSPSN